MKIISLTQGKFTAVNNHDYKWLSRYKWYALKGYSTWYAVRDVWRHGRKYTTYMHRAITKAKKGEQVDHRNGDGLDNWRKNLRKATATQNRCNRGPTKINRFGFKGVRLIKECTYHPWEARIQFKHKQISLGYYVSAEDAAHAYDLAAPKYHGEFARLNFPKKLKWGKL